MRAVRTLARMSGVDRDEYLLGTHDEEVARLGVQHRVWRPRVQEAWRRAGIGAGDAVLDVGAGPGFAACDLADVVGPAGRVVALERSSRFLHALRDQAQRRGLPQIATHQVDLDDADWPSLQVDHAWCRWVLAFVERPQDVLARIAARVRPGGTCVIFEYGDYASWRLMPPSAAFQRFVTTVMRAWRDDRGEPDIGLALPSALHAAGFDVVSVRPIVDVLTPADALWAWPAEFVRVGVGRLVAIGRLDEREGREIVDDFSARAARSTSRMLTPLVLEIIATRRSSPSDQV
jgi:SAM-dependent methyltransferase